jgi:signal transduction histidine kinase
MSWWPRTLFGRVALIVCGGLALAHLLTLAIIVRERGEQGMGMMLAYVGRDVATSVAILDHLPPPERAAWLPRLARQNYGYTLGAAATQASAAPDSPATSPAQSALAGPLREVIAAELGAARVGAMLQEGAPDHAWHLPLRLADGTALSLHLRPPHPTVSRTTLCLLGLQFSALAAAAWLAVRLAVRPLAQMAEMADATQADTPASVNPALLDTAPHEVRQAARAFQALQARIAAHLAERLQLLAAISHDLQTPITRMRVRTEQVADDGMRGKLQADLADMQALVEEGLAYARSAHAASEAPRALDLHALLDTLVCDAQDAGHAATLIWPEEALAQPLHTRVQALQRIVGNLLSNAIKFGGAAQIVVSHSDQALHIDVRDSGPGIPPDHIQAVLQPFYRLEHSRNRAHGGTGLGLAIAQQLTQALGGQLVLSNRAEGGLQARLTLPWR